MSLKVKCPGCGRKYELGEEYAGKKFRCKQCSQAVRVPDMAPAAPALSAEPSSADRITFRCGGCNKKYVTPANLAGKKIACKSCGQTIKIPGDPVSPSAVPQSSSKRDEPVVAAPPALDIYGLEDEPAATPSGPKALASGVLLDEEKLPPRAGYEPMTEAKKKKINRRAEKSDRDKPSFAGMGMGASFGSVLVLALITWRVYRFTRPIISVAQAISSASDEKEDYDPRVDALEHDKAVEAEVAAGKAPEAREWLDPKHADHVVFEMGNDAARKMVDRFSTAGAEAVYVLDPSEFGGKLVTAAFAVKLPSDPGQRKACFEVEREVLGLEPDETTEDYGQKYLDVAVD